MNHLQIILTKQHQKNELLKLLLKATNKNVFVKKQLTIEFLPPTSSQQKF